MVNSGNFSLHNFSFKHRSMNVSSNVDSFTNTESNWTENGKALNSIYFRYKTLNETCDCKKYFLMKNIKNCDEKVKQLTVLFWYMIRYGSGGWFSEACSSWKSAGKIKFYQRSDANHDEVVLTLRRNTELNMLDLIKSS